MSDKIEPALTPEQWEGSQGYGEIVVRKDGRPLDLSAHAIAALCLHGQPFGFTREDVKLIQAAEGTAKEVIDRLVNVYPGSLTVLHGLADLRARIEALLPPETT